LSDSAKSTFLFSMSTNSFAPMVGASFLATVDWWWFGLMKWYGFFLCYMKHASVSSFF
jgi:hypothetical protein